MDHFPTTAATFHLIFDRTEICKTISEAPVVYRAVYPKNDNYKFNKKITIIWNIILTQAIDGVQNHKYNDKDSSEDIIGVTFRGI